MFKNGTRALLILFTIVLALCVYNKLPEFLSIVGSLTCTPIAFILPALFHYKACATTVLQKRIDMAIVVFSTFILLFCTAYAIAAW